MTKPTTGVVVRTTHEGGLLVNVDGPVPKLGTPVVLESDGRSLGRVDTILGPVTNPVAHVVGIDRPLDEHTRVTFVMQQRSSKERPRRRLGKDSAGGYRKGENQQRDHRRSKNPSMANQAKGRPRAKSRDNSPRRNPERGSGRRGQDNRSKRGQRHRRAKR